MRIEGLWGASPPPPVWPGSPQTALIFVGLPLLTALVLLATPLHDAAPPTQREEAATPAGGDLLAPEPGVAERAAGAVELPRAFVTRQRTAAGRVPAVIYETRRTVDRPHENMGAGESGSAPAVAARQTSGAWLRTAPTPQLLRLAAATAESRAAAASLAPQSP